jgi:NitT/TauT family transport system ATP-binding protein
LLKTAKLQMMMADESASGIRVEKDSSAPPICRATKQKNEGETMSSVQIRDVRKSFGNFEVLHGVSIPIEDGEFVVLVGPSGCGKSTLLRIASGLDTPSTGRVDVDHDSLGYVFQDATLLPWRDVRGNVELFAELDGMGKTDTARRVAENVKLVGLDGFEDKYPKQLSGGMRMRASLARSLVMEPDIFLFDEPFGALDEITRERLNDELLGLFQRKGFGALFITHSITEAVFLSTRVMVMSQRPGRILHSFDVPIPYPRSHDLRFEPAFAELSGEVSHALRGAHT